MLSYVDLEEKDKLPLSDKAFNNVMIHKMLAMDKTCIFFPVIRLQYIQISNMRLVQKFLWVLTKSRNWLTRNETGFFQEFSLKTHPQGAWHLKID